MSGILRSTEQDDTSSCGFLSPLWSSNEDNIITIGDERAEAREHAQVPEVEPHDELTNETPRTDMYLDSG